MKQIHYCWYTLHTSIKRLLLQLLFIFHNYFFFFLVWFVVWCCCFVFTLFKCILFYSCINILPGYLKSLIITPIFLSHIILLESSSMAFKSSAYVRGIKRFKFQYLLKEFNYPTSCIWIHCSCCYCSLLIYTRFSGIVILINKTHSVRRLIFLFPCFFSLKREPLSGSEFYKF